MLDAISEEEYTLCALGSKNREPGNLDDLLEAGVIPDEDPVPTSRDLASGYVQFTRGSGGSDDTNFILTALMWGMDAAWGLYLADMVDTYDKYCELIHHEGHDQRIADKVFEHPTFQKKFGPKRKDWLDEENIYRFLLFGNSVPLSKLWEDAPYSPSDLKLPSSSQAWFNRLQYIGRPRKKKSKWTEDDFTTSLESHLDFIELGKAYEPPRGLGIAFDHVPASEFYESILQRLEFFKEKKLFPKKARNAPLKKRKKAFY